MDRMLAEVGLHRLSVMEPGTLFTWAWAVKPR
jgi:hypothetical protein